MSFLETLFMCDSFFVTDFEPVMTNNKNLLELSLEQLISNSLEGHLYFCNKHYSLQVTYPKS